eukprot:scaffold37087_cov60-Phaeocystis_antarctica.AAC.1
MAAAWAARARAAAAAALVEAETACYWGRSQCRPDCRATVSSPKASLFFTQGVAQGTTPLDRPAGGEGWGQGRSE